MQRLCKRYRDKDQENYYINKLHKLSNKYPRTDVIKKGWVKKIGAGSNLHWKITKSGEKALKKR